MRKWMLLIFLAAFAATLVFSQTREVRGFVVPELDENNNLKSQISGAHARYEGDLVHISELKIESFEDGEVDMTISSPKCLYNRATKVAQSKSRVRIERENMVITGEDYIYASEGRVFEIKKDVKVVMVNAGRRGSLLKKEKEE